MARALPLLLAPLLLTACAFVLPATWRQFRVDPDDAAPAITRALDQRGLEVNEWKQADREIITTWTLVNDGVEQVRERYRIRWEKNEDDGTTVIYVRHQAQDRVVAPGDTEWSTTWHDGEKEATLLDAITAELRAAYESPPPAPPVP